MYRPEGWEEIKPKGLEDIKNPDAWKHYNGYIKGFEAGADAMLEGVRKEGTVGEFYNCNRIDVCGLASPPPESTSYLVFIPEEE